MLRAHPQACRADGPRKKKAGPLATVPAQDSHPRLEVLLTMATENQPVNLNFLLEQISTLAKADRKRAETILKQAEANRAK